MTFQITRNCAKLVILLVLHVCPSTQHPDAVITVPKLVEGTAHNLSCSCRRPAFAEALHAWCKVTASAGVTITDIIEGAGVLGGRLLTLFRYRASIADHGKSILCQLKGFGGIPPTTTSLVALNIIFGPQQVSITSGLDTQELMWLTQDTQATLYCVASLVFERAHMDWTYSLLQNSDESTMTCLDISFLNGTARKCYRTLKFTPKATDHTKRIECAASNADERRFNEVATVALMVMYGPTSLELRAAGGALLQGVVTVNVDTLLTLTCVTDRVYSGVTLEWSSTRTQGVIDATDCDIHGACIFSRRTFFTTSKSDNQQVLRCNAVNSNVASLSESASVLLNVIYGPSTVTVSGPGTSVVNQTLTLTCDTDEVNPKANFTWVPPLGTLGQTTFTATTHGGKICHQSITFTSAASDNGRTITCTATNIVSPNKTSRNTKNITILYGPTSLEVNVTNGTILQGMVSVNSGDQLKLTCVTDRVNSDAIIEWAPEIRQGNIDNNDCDNHGACLYFRSAYITPSKADHKTRLTCNAVNSNATTLKKSTSVRLNVTYGPSAVGLTLGNQPMNARRGYNVTANRELTLTCETDEVNPAVTFMWAPRLGSLSTIRPTIKTNGDCTYSQNMTFTPTVSDNEQLVSCTATNTAEPSKTNRATKHLYVLDVNECETDADNCSDTAECRDIIGSFTCHCLTGYEGNGTHCTGVICPTPSTVVNSFPILSPPYHFPQMLQYKCVHGYTLAGAESIECQANRTWSDPVPNCAAVECAATLTVANGFITSATAKITYTYTDVIIYGCTWSHHISSGSRTRRCQADGTWSNTQPVCSDNSYCLLRSDCHQTANCSDNKCQCQRGYDGNGASCIDTDECVINAHNCDVNAECINRPGSFRCVCRTGYQGDGKSCTGVSCQGPAAVENGRITNATCKPTYSYSDCIAYACDLGYHRTRGTTNTRTCRANGTWSNTPPLCQDNIDCSSNSSVCDANATCDITSGRCQCQPGYDGNGTSCEDIDECATKADNCNVNADCENTVGSFICTCRTGFEGSGTSCLDVNECETYEDNCHNNSKCRNTIGSFTCHCKPGYEGSGTNCTDVNECDTDEDICPDTAECRNKIGNFTCYCLAGYEGNGTYCTGLICPPPSTVVNSFPILSPPYHFPQTLQYKCVVGYTLVGAESIGCQANRTWSDPVPDCAAVECTYPATVTNGTITNATAKITYTYTDVIVYECSQFYHISSGSRTRKCQADGTWSNTQPVCSDNSYCTLQSDCHQTARCSVNRCQCQPGNEGDGSSCTDIDECAVNAHNCDINAGCINEPSSFRCVCRTGYRGYDGTSCTAVTCPEPAAVGNGSVTNATSKPMYSYSDVIAYACDHGYHRTIGTTNTITCQANGTWSNTPPTCQDNIDCSSNSSVCGANASCDTISGRCQCQPGYEGNGTTCEDIDECTTKAGNCNVNADCTNTMGSFICSCRTGYEGSGTSCLDVDECETNTSTCHVNAHCRNTVGRFTCHCMTGYEGNGTFCTACPAPSTVANTYPTAPPPYEFHQKLQYRCRDGYNLVDTGIIECLANGSWSTPSPECSALSCAVPAPVDNANVTSVTFKLAYSYTDVILYECVPTYRMSDGPRSRVCQADGTWSYPPPSCTACPIPSTVANSYPTAPPPYEFHQRLQYRCLDAHNLVGAEIIECQANGSWSEPVPDCKAVTCAAPPPVANVDAARTSYKSTYSYTDVIAYMCRKGYHLSADSRVRVCQANGTWSNTPPICADNVNYSLVTGCPAYPLAWSFDSFKCQCREGYDGDGSSCTDIDECVFPYNCAEPNTYCFNYGGGHICPCILGYIWNGNLCTVMTCRAPSTEVNARITLATFKTSYTYKDIISYVCDFGYHRKTGTTTNRTCQANGTWSNNQPTCEDNVDCSSNIRLCGTNATCQYLQNTEARCQCKTGYDGDGVLCEDVDECATNANICIANADCTNTVGSFVCSCTTGYDGSAKDVCKDKNECNNAPSPCHTNATCTNTPGNYTCVCHVGFTGDGCTCDDVNECFGSNYPCHVNATCENDVGSFLCTCRPGLSGDGGTTCDDIDECTLSMHNCHPMANCVNIPESFKCSCKTGYVGNGTSCSDFNECNSPTHACHSNANCLNNDGSYECSCFGGFSGNGKYCENVNECNESSHDCHPEAICEDTIGSFTCSCMSGYQGNGKRCVNVDECANNALNNCSVNAVCADTDPSYNCTCKGGYSDDSGNGFTCLDIDECDSNTTSQCNQKCANEPGSYHCKCYDGFSLEPNQITCTDNNECNETPSPCHTNATCTNTPGNYTCVCHIGFTGDGCTCDDVNECFGSNYPCHVNATCENDVGSFICTCRPGLSGDGRTNCDDIDECTLSKHNCHPMAKCVNIPESFKCTCKTGYIGNGTSCSDVNECDSPTDPVCHSNATCLNNDGSYACSCLDGFSGNEKYCENINECNVSFHDCHSKAICEDTIGSFTCSCISGYQGNGKKCVNIDECADGSLNNCSVNAVCTDTHPLYNCTCKGGFSDDNGNGFTCLDIDECDSNSTNHCNQKCINKPGSYHCKCNEGFSMEPDQTTCTVITCSTFPTVLKSSNNGSAVYAFYNDKVSFVCNTGYAVSAGVTSQTISCTGINTWTPSVKNCEAVKCLSPDRVLFSTMTESKAEFSYRDQLTYSCDSGFDLAGVATLVCQADNTWSSKEPVCAVGPTSLIIHDDDGVYNNAAVTIETGTEATLTCLTDNVLPSPVIQWRSGIGDQSAINQISPDPKTGSSKFMRNITLTPLMVNNGDRLVCSAYNSLLTGVILTSTVVLNVVINGQWSIWGAWTKCTASCDYGTRQRRRWCSNPAPSSNGGKQCPNYPSEFEACYGYFNLPCKNFKDQEESKYLIANVIDKQESTYIMLFAFSVLGITGISGFIWYMRDNYKRQAKKFRLTAMDEFDGLIKRLAQLLQEDEDEGDGKDAHLNEEAILERSRDIVKQKIRELQKFQPDEKPTAFTIDHFFKACNEIVVNDTKEDNPVVTTQPETVQVTFDNENATIHMKNKILKRVLRRENKSLNRIKIEKALNDYIAFNKMHKTKLELDRTLLKQTNKIVLITALRSLLLIALNNEDINSLQRIIGSIEAKGATVYMSAEVEEAKTKLQALLAIEEVKHALCKMDRRLIYELKGYKYPPPHVHEVMVATLLILGENEIVTRDWGVCHNLCSSLGTAHSHGLYYRITNFKSDKLHPGIAARALEILHHCNENEIKASSAAATHFYYWTRAVAEEKVNKAGADVTPITGRRQVQVLNRLFNISPVKHTPKRMSAAKRALMRKITDVPEIVIHDPSEEDVTDQEDTVSQNEKEELERQAELRHKREEIQEVIDLKSMGLSLTDVTPPRKDTFVFDDFSF